MLYGPGVMEQAVPVNNRELIAAAVDRLRPNRRLDGATFGTVAASLISGTGTVYRGVNLDTPCGTGFCAEHSAIAAMVTAGEYRITKIVAVWRARGGQLHVVAPCGRCREFMRQVDEANLDTQVVLGMEQQKALKQLLPDHQWPGEQLSE